MYMLHTLKFLHMKNLLFLLILVNYGFLTAQEFSFEIFFEDSAGNQDSIILGYDDAATFGIDSSFGEINIINVPYSAGLDVRVTDEWSNRENSIPPTFHTKKQIYQEACPNNFLIPVIDIVTDNWPVTATWDNSLFNDVCRNGSVFTSIHPLGWWDTGSPSDLLRVVLSDVNEVTFTSNYDGDFNPAYAYINDNGDIIPIYWQTFGDQSIILSISENYETDIKIFPNPTNDFLYYEIDAPELISEINIYDINGRKQNIQDSDNSLDLKILTSGIYFIEFFFKDNRREMRQIIKQ